MINKTITNSYKNKKLISNKKKNKDLQYQIGIIFIISSYIIYSLFFNVKSVSLSGIFLFFASILLFLFGLMYLKDWYKQAYLYVKGLYKYIFVIFAIFFLSFLVGLFFPVFFVDQIKEMLRRLLERTIDLNTFEMITFILSNNVSVSFSSLLLGSFFGIFPLFIALQNGYLLGFVLNFAIEEAGYSIIWKLFPHGIFELPAVLISLSLGLKLGMSFFSKNPLFIKEFKERAVNSLKVFILIVIPLLIIAALIESLFIGLLK